MKTLKKLSKDERLIIFMVVNNPPDGMPGFTNEEGAKREPLLKKIMEGLEMVNSNIDFTPVENKDLTLEDDLLFILLECFQKARFPTMMDRENANKLKQKIHTVMGKS